MTLEWPCMLGFLGFYLVCLTGLCDSSFGLLCRYVKPWAWYVCSGHWHVDLCVMILLIPACWLRGNSASYGLRLTLFLLTGLHAYSWDLCGRIPAFTGVFFEVYIGLCDCTLLLREKKNPAFLWSILNPFIGVRSYSGMNPAIFIDWSPWFDLAVNPALLISWYGSFYIALCEHSLEWHLRIIIIRW